MVFLALYMLMKSLGLSDHEKMMVAGAEAYNACMIGQYRILTDEFGETRAGVMGKERCLAFLAPVLLQIRHGFYNDDTGWGFDDEEFTMDTITKACKIPAEKTMEEMKRYYKRFNRPEMYTYEVNKKTIASMCPEAELKKHGTIYKVEKKD